MDFVTDAAEACRRALGVDAVPLAPGSTSPGTTWAAATFLDREDPPSASVWTVREGSPPIADWPGPIVVAEHAAGSQFVRLQELLASRSSVPDALACVAVSGARFRGQRGRSWATLRGNLHVSVHLELDVPAAEHQASLAVLPAVAACRAIERASDGAVRPGLKWVNDLLLGDRKVGGVLSASHVEAGRVRHLVLGIGVNVAAMPDLPPSPRALPPVRLADVDPSFDEPYAWGRLLGPLLDELAAARDALTSGPGAALVDAYRERSAFLGRTVTIWPVAGDDGADDLPIAQGRVDALLPDLSLRIAGHEAPIRQGRMTLDRDDAEPDGGARPR